MLIFGLLVDDPLVVRVGDHFVVAYPFLREAYVSPESWEAPDWFEELAVPWEDLDTDACRVFIEDVIEPLLAELAVAS